MEKCAGRQDGGPPRKEVSGPKSGFCVREAFSLRLISWIRHVLNVGGTWGLTQIHRSFLLGSGSHRRGRLRTPRPLDAFSSCSELCVSAYPTLSRGSPQDTVCSPQQPLRRALFLCPVLGANRRGEGGADP